MLKNQINGKIPRSSVTDTEKITPHDFCYKYSIHSPDCFSGKLKVKDFNDETHFPFF